MSSRIFQFKNTDQPDENEISILNGLNQRYVSTFKLVPENCFFHKEFQSPKYFLNPLIILFKYFKFLL